MQKIIKVNKNCFRVEFLDYARGIGLLLVVVGHSEFAYKYSIIYEVIYSFHVPLFFFISGLLHKDFDSGITEIKLRVSKLLLPFYFTAFVYAVLKSMSGFQHFWENEWVPFSNGVLWGTGGRGSAERFLFWPPMWFLTSLFVTQLMFSVLQKVVLVNVKGIIRTVIMIVVLFFGVYYLSHWGKNYWEIGSMKLIAANNGVWYNIDLLPITLFYYWLGFELREIKNNEVNNLRLTLIVCIGTIVFYLIVYAYVEYNPSLLHRRNVMDLNYRNYGGVITSTLLAIIGIMIVISFCMCLSRIKETFLLKQLSKYGRYGLVVLVFHYVFQHNISSYFKHSNFGAYLGLIAGVIAPIFLAKVMKRIRFLRKIYHLA